MVGLVPVVARLLSWACGRALRRGRGRCRGRRWGAAGPRAGLLSDPYYIA